MENQLESKFSLTSFLNANYKYIIPALAAIVVVLIAGGGYFLFQKGLIKVPFLPAQKKQVGQEVKKEEVRVAEPIIPYKQYDEGAQAGPFACPSVETFCQTAKYTDSGFGGNLPNGSPLYAAFDGEVEIQTGSFTSDKGSETYSAVLLVNKEKGLQAMYSFQLKGKPEGSQQRQVKEGEEIIKISGEQVKFLKGNSLTFKLFKASPGGMEEVKLTKESFK